MRWRRNTTQAAAIAARAAAALVISAALVLTLAQAAFAVSKPSVTTGSAHAVSYSSALATGSVNPNGAETYYYVQYGQTKAYGQQTAIARLGSGTKNVAVSVALSGLQPVTQYHYRLVAVNGAGSTAGSDVSFLTTKIPLSLQIIAAPNPVTFGRAIVVEGTLSGTGSGGRAVVLQADAFPFAVGFQNVGNAIVTNPDGGFQFALLNMTTVTQLRVVTTTSPPIISPVATEEVALSVSYHLAPAHRAHHLRFVGTVTPAQDGARVGILRIVHGRGVPVGGTTLHHHSATSSSFTSSVRARRGLYRVLVLSASGAQVSAYGRSVFIR